MDLGIVVAEMTLNALRQTPTTRRGSCSVYRASSLLLRIQRRSPSPERRGGQGVRTSRRLRRLTTTARPRLRLVLGLERPSHVAGTLPRSHQLGIIAEPIADHLVQQADPHPLTPSPSGRGER